MRKIVFILVVPLILAMNCSQKKPKSEPETTRTIRLVTPILAERNLNLTEKSIVKEICEAFKSKRELFRTFPNGSQGANFNVETRDCNSRFQKLGTYKTLLITEGELRFVGHQNILSDILVDNKGPLKPICDAYFNRDTSLLNLYLDGDQQYLYSFKNFGTNVFFQAAIFSNTEPQDLRHPSPVEEGIIYTRSSAPREDLVGVLFQRTRFEKCSNGENQFKRQIIK